MDDSEFEEADEDFADVWARLERMQAAARQIAGLIADGHTRDRLAKTIAEVVLVELESEIASRSFTVLPTDLRAKIERYRQALEVVGELAGDPYISGQTLRHWPADAPHKAHALWIKALVEAAPVERQALAAAEKSLRGARKRLGMAFYDASPEWFCAAHALLIWRTVRLDPPKMESHGFAKLCAALWKGAGGMGEPKWRDRAKDVLRVENANDQPYLRRWLVEHADRIAFWMRLQP